MGYFPEALSLRTHPSLVQCRHVDDTENGRAVPCQGYKRSELRMAGGETVGAIDGINHPSGGFTGWVWGSRDLRDAAGWR